MVKYSYSFSIVSTFLVLFLCELASKKNIILLQYAILGISLVLFYLMLLSFSEYIGFDLAYLISTLGIVVPISLYTLGIMEEKRFSIAIATILFIFNAKTRRICFTYRNFCGYAWSLCGCVF